jgi:hypothetical protein
MHWKAGFLLLIFLYPPAWANTALQEQQQQSSASSKPSAQVNLPDKTDALHWASSVLTNLFNIDHKRYAQQYASCCKHFYGPTWRKLMHQVRQSGELKNLVKQKLIKKTQVQSPQIINTLELSGLKGWRVQAPLTIQYFSKQTSQSVAQPINTQHRTVILDIVLNPKTGVMKIINFEQREQAHP